MWGLRTSALRLGYVASLPQTSSSSSTMVSKKAWTRRDNVVISCVCQQQVRWFARPSIGNAKSSVHKIKAKEIIKNSEISKDYNELRVVYTDDSTGKDEHKIMSRLEALNLAKSMSLDLILVAGNSNPPVCRIDDSGMQWQTYRHQYPPIHGIFSLSTPVFSLQIIFFHHLRSYCSSQLITTGLKRVEQEKKVKEMKAKAKSKIVKEIHVGCTIGPHDLEVKMNKVREFIERIKMCFPVVDMRIDDCSTDGSLLAELYNTIEANAYQSFEDSSSSEDIYGENTVFSLSTA